MKFHQQWFAAAMFAVWLGALAAAPGRCDAGSGADPLPELGGNASAETALAAAATDGPSAADLERIAKMTSNPLGAAWMLWWQNDLTEVRGDLVPGGELVNTTRFQPVMSFPLDPNGADWNLIVRPVIQYQSVPLDADVGRLLSASPETITSEPELSRILPTAWDDRTNGFGDTALLTLVGPNRLDGFIWGVGASQIFPTAERDVLGQGKWQAGPAFLAAKLAPKPGGFNIGALAQHWWSYAGDSDRAATNQTDIQYFINYRLSGTQLIGMSPNITIDWTADSGNQLTLPVGLGYSNVYKIGPLPVRVAIEAQYSLIAPDNVGRDWNLRLLFIPVIPNPFR
ncbi:hypothetical protein [Thiocapsa sp.]|uniref:hypothetical protein n=1 Tax=Thiocapsa sp. TaxID=2024551 RepID=UPI002B8C94A1|nr:hypothetical protein [Thiocapsa sp.]HSO81676.1 hypothetical protein [Thiocapsa sp.]